MTLTNFGLVDVATQHMEEARQHYKQALEINRQLAAQNPIVYQPNLAMALNNLARTERLQNQIEQSRAHYQEALTLLRSLAQTDAKYEGQVQQVESTLRQLGN
jgi:tetratricopeptide (TPR) repeat protein